VIIDSHAHIVMPPESFRYMAELVGGRANPSTTPKIPDASVRKMAEEIVKIMDSVGTDVQFISPRPYLQMHSVKPARVSELWSRHCNDLIARFVALFPDRFRGVAGLPQYMDEPLEVRAIPELRRCVEQLGFIGCNLNPDPGGGHFTHPPLTDESWFPIYEVMCELDVPAMIHVSGSCNPAMHATGGFYIAADTVAFMQLLQGDLFGRFPTLRFIIPHGGGGVPFHWGRYRGLADMLKQPSLDTHLMNNVFFDTCVYHQPGVDLLAEVIETKNILFGSEMVGAVRGIDPTTGHYFDDTKRYVDALPIDTAAKHAIFEGNARRVFPRLDAKLKAQGR